MRKGLHCVELIKSQPLTSVKYMGALDCFGFRKHVWSFHCSGCRSIVRILCAPERVEILVGRGEWKAKEFKVVCDNPDCDHIFYLTGLPAPEQGHPSSGKLAGS